MAKDLLTLQFEDLWIIENPRRYLSLWQGLIHLLKNGVHLVLEFPMHLTPPLLTFRSIIIPVTKLECKYLEYASKLHGDARLVAMSKELVSDEQWRIVEPLLPTEPSNARGSRLRIPDRVVIR